MWILPEMEIFASNPDLKDYRGHPLGNIPELFKPDSCLKTCFYKALGYHVRYTHSLIKFDLIFSVFQRQQKEHQLTFGSLIQLTSSPHQANGSYPTRMMYSHQSSILWRLKAALSQMTRM